MSEKALDKLLGSGLSQEDAIALGIFPTDNARMLHIGFASEPALAIPYYDPGTGTPMTYGADKRPFLRVRYLETVYDKAGKEQRYTQPGGSGMRAYFPRTAPWAQIIANTDIPIVITEGELKAASACGQRIACIGLGGVNSFKAEGKLIPELEIPYANREVIIGYDSDAEVNPNVRQAELALYAELEKRGARVRIARLTPSLDGKKRGLDDYIAEGNVNELKAVLANASAKQTTEAHISALNAEVAYIEDKDCILVLAEGLQLTKSAFEKGSRFSSLETTVTKKTSGGKAIEGKTKLAPIWLTHHAARRYAGTVFDPASQASEIPSERGMLLNRWQGFLAKEGDIKPFMDLTDFIFSRTEEGIMDTVLKLYAYKAQNPAEKIPLCLVLIGLQGCGKSLWARVMGRAFEPYYFKIFSTALKADFMPFLENSLMVVIDEAKAIDTHGAKERLKTLISDQQQELNKKYVGQAQIKTYCQFILTANDRKVGQFDHDDRRNIVIGCPDPREGEFYDRVLEWERNDGPKALMHWMLHVDLQGWKPPKHAPMTAEKRMAYVESLGPVERLAEEMKTSTQNVVSLWIESALAWARVAQAGSNAQEASRGRAIQASLSTVQIRPWYTAEELALMFPHMANALHGNKDVDRTITGELSLALRNNGIRHLRCRDNPEGFMLHGRRQQFLIVSQPDRWVDGITQAEFETHIATFPRFGQA